MTIEEVLRIMTWVEVLIKIACIIFGIFVAITITGPSLVKAIKKRKAAETAEEKAQAALEIQLELENCVAAVESSYKTLDSALRSLGTTAGIFKKDKVLSDLREFCDEKGYEYNKDELSIAIDKFVAKTKVVNVEKK